MILIRSLLFNVLFYANLVIQMLIWVPIYFVLPRQKAWAAPKFWSRSSIWLHRVIAGTKYEVEGLENLPEGAYILSPKHQSLWDVVSFLPFLKDPVYILKQELTRIPLFGWFINRMGMIPIDRKHRSKALRNAVVLAKERLSEPRQLVIYPEGTRRPPGSPPEYKYGIVELYAKLNVPVVPVAHMAGLYWPRRKFLRYPGTITARFLPPIQPGLSRSEFFERLVRETEAASDELLIKAALSKNPPPLPVSARQRLAELGVKIDN